MKKLLKSFLIGLFVRIVGTSEGKDALVGRLRNLLPAERDSMPLYRQEQPFADLGTASRRDDPDRSSTIFITGRFRSGSTLLWNIFRHLDGFTAYYEPFNERRWFDTSVRGNFTDSSHLDVDNYWAEYDSLAELSASYREDWMRENLYMGADDWAPYMRTYIDTIISKAPSRPVLQFNRIDFRLPWIKRNYPASKIVHIYRHPRDQWCSTLIDPRNLPYDADMTSLARHDKFYLSVWIQDLKYHFPFIHLSDSEHPYKAFFYIWKLSFLFGRQYANYSLSLESLVHDPQSTLERLLRALDVPVAGVANVCGLINPVESGRWRRYANADWFRGIESECEQTLSAFLGEAI